jgi:hypothetical protein
MREKPYSIKVSLNILIFVRISSVKMNVILREAFVSKINESTEL